MTAAITTPFPTLEEVADNVGISRHRAQELAALASELTGKQITVYRPKKAKRSPRVAFKKVAFKKK
jgi:orotate phosphoribosyltransferase-like protein